MEMNLTDIVELEYLVRLTMAKKGDPQRMENFIKKFIDPKCTVCPHCSGQIKFAHKRIVNYWEANATSISQRKMQLIAPPEIKEQKKEELEELKCKCGETLADKRYKFCSKKCRDEARRKNDQ